MNPNYLNIPAELRGLPQWCLAGPDKSPHGFSPMGVFRIDVRTQKHSYTFDQVVAEAAKRPNYGIGFILRNTDPFTCIDLDVKNATNEPDVSKHTSAEDIQRFGKIVEAFDCYTERSASGQGIHIWTLGNIGPGLRRDGVEVYSQERFIVCTGDVTVNKPIADRSDLLAMLTAEMKTARHDAVALEETEETETDEVIFRRAFEADNGDKFQQLCSGDFSDYPSQSEADLALMSMFTFYSRSNEQCRRMFRMTELGKREKAVKNDRYLNDTLRRIRSRQAKEDEFENFAVQQAANFAASVRANLAATAPAPTAPQTAPAPAAPQTAPAAANVPPPVPVQGQPVQMPPAAANLPKGEAEFRAMIKKAAGIEEIIKQVATPEEIAKKYGAAKPIVNAVQDDEGNDDENPLQWPPGVVGELANYFYKNAVRPVKEIAIASALGFLSGVCGRAFNYNNSGLNLYIVVIAQSGVGKEALHTNLSMLQETLSSSSPSVGNYLQFTDFASGQALMKASNENPSMVSVFGEIGHLFKRLADENGRDPSAKSLRMALTNLYHKSTRGVISAGMSYSDKEKNVDSVSGVSFSLIGETTPDSFYECLTNSMMSDGFLSRFLMIEYKGLRKRTNKDSGKFQISPRLQETLCSLVSRADGLNHDNNVQDVTHEPLAHKILDNFDIFCDDRINESEDENVRQMWNRAHIKALRIAGCLAVADNYVTPVVKKAHVDWAIDLVKRDISKMNENLLSGNIGGDDSAREKKLCMSIVDFLTTPPAKSYKVPLEMWQEGIVTRSFLQIKVQRSPVFTAYRGGQNKALDHTIESAIANGYLSECGRPEIAKKYGFAGKCYRILDLPAEYDVSIPKNVE